MIFDSTMLAALSSGLNALRGARLRDLWQGRADDGNRAADSRALTLVFNDARRGDLALLIETDPNNARLHFLQRVPKTPDAPTALTDLLRKTLRGARFEGAVQPNFERILQLRFTARDAIGDESNYLLIAEIMDRRSNAILLDANGVIFDAVKRLPPFLNRARTILPHREYAPPPSRRANPLDVTDWQPRVLAALRENAAASDVEARIFDGALWLRDGFNGVSPLAAADLRATATRVLAAKNDNEKVGDERAPQNANVESAARNANGENADAGNANPKNDADTQNFTGESAARVRAQHSDGATENAQSENDSRVLAAQNVSDENFAVEGAARVLARQNADAENAVDAGNFVHENATRVRAQPHSETGDATEKVKGENATRVLAARNASQENAVAAAWSAAFDSFFARVQKAAHGDYAPHRCENSQPYPFALEGENCEAAGFSEARKSSGRENRDDDQKPLESALRFSALLEEVARTSTQSSAIDEARAALLSQLGARRKLNAAQRSDAEKALQHAAAAAHFNLEGQLILSHVAQVEDAARRGETFVELPDEYSQLAQDGDHDAPLLRIEIESKWSAADNAARCFSRYRRARKLGEGAPARRAKLETEAAEIADWEEKARRVETVEEIENIARESGAAPSESDEKSAASTRGETLSRSKREALAARPENKLRRRDLGEFALFMGRNAVENQLLLSKVASPSDMWMHVRGRPSAHVIVKGPKGKTPPPQVLHEAGLWVASVGGRVPVGEKIEIIYTQAKFVRAVRGAPGRVTLGRFQTLLVEARDERDSI